MNTVVPLARAALIACLSLIHLAAKAQKIQTGKSYVNLTKGVSGGTIEVGDILEIRATIAVGDFSTTTVTNLRYTDTIPANTTYIANSLQILTNEGLLWKAFTDASDGDRGRYAGGFLRINMGSSYNNNVPSSVNLGVACSTVDPATGGGGKIQHNGRPSFFGGVCIMSASYRIRINAVPANTIISTYGGAFRYTYNSSNYNTHLTPYSIAIAPNLGLCINAIGGNAIIEYGGTFGNASTQNRTTSAIVPGYTFGNVAHDFPNDGSYSIVNNLSPTGNTNPNAPRPDNATSNAAVARVHRLWDIMGDHTGSTVPALGNAPTAPGSPGGYFVAINSSYANTNAIQQTIGGLCPNTYYEFSAWFKNICKYCASDSTADGPYREVSGVRVPNTNFNGPDSSGVNPNLTFTVNGNDYYTSGNLKYTGTWVKRGFVYKTGPSQTSFTVTIRNNAAGGGGNDWAIDDVSVATCTPNLNLVPSGNAQVCYGNQVDMSTTVRSYYDNYIQWTWEKSTDGGATWLSTGRSGSATPTLVGGEYEYVDHFPSYLADSSVHNNIFRIRVASSPTNLADPVCSFTNTVNIVVMVNNCMHVLNKDHVTITGKLDNGYALINWSSYAEQPGVRFEVERSRDKINYTRIATIKGSAPTDEGTNYNFRDPLAVDGETYYRIKVAGITTPLYSKAVLLSNKSFRFQVKSLVNPVANNVSFDLVTPADEVADITITDAFGRIVNQSKHQVNQGLNHISITGARLKSAGNYMMKINCGGNSITKQLIVLRP
jgi:uncharacterized repeat protein (TIGR01451 family)